MAWQVKFLTSFCVLCVYVSPMCLTFLYFKQNIGHIWIDAFDARTGRADLFYLWLVYLFDGLSFQNLIASNLKRILKFFRVFFFVSRLFVICWKDSGRNVIKLKTIRWEGEKTRTEINVSDDDLPQNGSEMKGTNENRIEWGGILKMFSSKWKKEKEKKKPKSRQYKMWSEKQQFGAVHSRLIA